MPTARPSWPSAALLCLCACAAVAGDPWSSGGVIFEDGDVVARMSARRSSDGVDLSWIGVRSSGARELRSVRVILFDDANGDLEPQPEEQLTRWSTQSPLPQREFSVFASFSAENMKPEVMARLRVFTEVGYVGPGVESVSETRPLP